MTAESLSRASVPQDADQPLPESKEAPGPFGEGAPFVVLEHIKVAGQEFVRVVCTTWSEMVAHDVASALADAGLRVWFIDLWPEGGGKPTGSRYVGASGAAWLHAQGLSGDDPDAGERLTAAGR